MSPISQHRLAQIYRVGLGRDALYFIIDLPKGEIVLADRGFIICSLVFFVKPIF